MVMESFLRVGVDTIFGLPGGANLPLYDVLPEYYPRIKHYMVKHEQAAAHAADAYARIKGQAGVCYGTSGPGATNLVTGIANAFMDSVPLVCVTGQVIRALIGRDGYTLTAWNLEKGGCLGCGTPLSGVLEETPGDWGSRRQPVRLAEFAS